MNTGRLSSDWAASETGAVLAAGRGSTSVGVQAATREADL
jgi:hypothetical protein